MCSLLKSIGQYGKGSSRVTSTLNIEVDYNSEENEVRAIVSVYVLDLTDYRRVDITYIMGEYFEEAINKIIDETDWKELYHETRELVA